MKEEVEEDTKDEKKKRKKTLQEKKEEEEEKQREEEKKRKNNNSHKNHHHHHHSNIRSVVTIFSMSKLAEMINEGDDVFRMWLIVTITAGLSILKDHHHHSLALVLRGCHHFP